MITGKWNSTKALIIAAALVAGMIAYSEKQMMITEICAGIIAVCFLHGMIKEVL